MIDWDDSGSSSDDDTDGLANVTKAVSHLGETTLSTARGSMRGLQIAIQEGWLVQRARDMCSFAHDRYRQAAEAEALNLPDGSMAKMSFRVWCSCIASQALRQLTLRADHPDDAARTFA